MIYTFYKAQGYAVGKSLVEEDKLDLATSLIEKAKAKGVSLLLPTDIVVADKFAADAESKVCSFMLFSYNLQKHVMFQKSAVLTIILQLKLCIKVGNLCVSGKEYLITSHHLFWSCINEFDLKNAYHCE